MRTGLMGLASVVTALLMTGAAYSYGMFFDELMYRLEWPICLIAMLAASLVSWRRLGKRWGLGVWNGEGDWRKSIAVLGLLLVGLLYGLSLMLGPVSVLGSLNQALRWCLYSAFLLLLSLVFGSPGSRQWLSIALQASGIMVVGFALAGWMGGVSFPSLLLRTGDARVSAVGVRLGGFVQYANVMGAIACTYLVWSLLLLLRARTAGSAVLVSVTAVPYALVVLLTESRGAWLVGLVVWLTGCFMLRGKERSAWLLYSGWTLLCAGAACRFIIHAGLRGSVDGSTGAATALETFLLLVVLVLAAAGFLTLRMLLMERYRHRFNGGKVSWIGLLGGATGMLILLPSAVYGRLGGVSGGYGGNGTVGARELFYRDAWELIRQAPLLGRGGDAWRHLFMQVQSQPYVGNEVHSGYLELALDLGLVGLLAAILVITMLLGPVWKKERLGSLPIGVLLLHAGIDFDMSYGYYWLLLLGLVVYYWSGEASLASAAAEWRGRRYAWLRASGSRRHHLRAAMMTAAAVCFGAAAVLGWRFDAAAQHREAAWAAASGAARTAALRAALEANPYWTRIRLELAEQAPPQERAALLTAGLRYEPQSVPLLWALGRQYAERGDVRSAAFYMSRGLERDRFSRKKQTEAVVTMEQLAEMLQAASRFKEAKLAAAASQAFFANYAALDRQYAVNGRKFAVTAAARAAATRAAAEQAHAE